MNVRHLFGKTPARLLQSKPSRVERSWLVTLALLCVAGLIAWAVQALLAADAKEKDEMIYFWPE
jgi:hypothetical protein